MSDEPKKIGKITVDRNLCIGAASCVIAAGDVFELDTENKAVLILKDGTKNSGPVVRGALQGGADDAILLAAQSCPTKAIVLNAEDGTQIYP